MRRFVALLALACLALRYPSLIWPLGPDESGYALVAKHWDPGPGSLYGPYFVDRPPLLIGLYAAAESLGAPYLPRLMAAIAAAATVVIGARVGYLLGGARAVRWTAVAAVALVCNPLLGSYQAKGEILGLPLVLASCWLSLEALRRPHDLRRLALAGAAGLTAVLAMGLKQNLYGGLVFGGLLLAGAVLSRRCPAREAVGLAAAAIAGAAVPVVALLSWAQQMGIEASTLWGALYSFRSDALTVITSQSLLALNERASVLAQLFLLSGIGLALAAFAVRHREVRADLPHVAVAVTGLAFADLVAVALGGAYWSSYLIPVVASTLMIVALLGARSQRLTVGATAIAAGTALAVFTAVVVTGAVAPTRHYAGQAIGEVAHPDDSIVSVYGAADLVNMSDLQAPYPYLWSLPVRVLDPDLDDLVRLVTGPDRPTWVAQPLPINSWELDHRRLLRTALRQGYRDLGRICGVRVFVRSDVQREPPASIGCDRPFWRTVVGPADAGPTTGSVPLPAR